MKLLIIEDSERLRNALLLAMKQSGYVADAAADGEEALWYLEQGGYDLVILDLMLPKVDGLTILRSLQSETPVPAILILSSKDSVEDKVKGLQGGADDYLAKPFSLEELLARVHSLWRRSQTGACKRDEIHVGPLRLDLFAKEVSCHGKKLRLNPREYRLLETLASEPGRVFSKSELYQKLYDELTETMSNVIDSSVSKLRRTLSEAGSEGLIQTRRGLGYALGEPR